MSSCANCGNDNDGAFCSACGQAHAELHKSVRVFLGEAFENFIHFDAKILGTLRPLFFQPGKLSEEYLAGKRVRYVPPFRLYVSVSFVFFLLLAMRPQDLHKTIIQVQPSSLQAGQSESDSYLQEAADIRQKAQATNGVGHWFSLHIAHFLETMAANPDSTKVTLISELFGALPKVVFVLVPWLAFLLFALFRRQRAFFVDHLVVALYLHAFAFALFTVDVLATWRWESKGFDLLTLLALFIYALLTLRRVYALPWWSTLWRATVSGTAYFLTVGAGVMLALFSIFVRL